MSKNTPHPKVGFFATCLVDAMRPSIGFACLKLLEDAGCDVTVPDVQTCCGQPAFNGGADQAAQHILKQVVGAFEDFDYIVVPSGSCAGMLRIHGTALFDNEPNWRERHALAAAKTYEISSFLVDVLDYSPKAASYQGVATYHDSCSGLRELNIRDQPRKLLSSVDGLTLVPLEDGDVCCGFGGTFCVKYPEISNQIVGKKAHAIERSGADTLLAGDLGCLMNMAGKLSRLGSAVKAYHVVEILAGMTDEGAICQPSTSRA